MLYLGKNIIHRFACSVIIFSYVAKMSTNFYYSKIQDSDSEPKTASTLSNLT